MVELNIARPAADERTSVEILNATDAQGVQLRLDQIAVILSESQRSRRSPRKYLRVFQRDCLDFARNYRKYYAQASSAGAGVARVSVDRGEICR